MLVLFILCALLRTLQGASVPSPPGSVAPTSMSTLLGRAPPAVPDNGCQQLRTAYSIAQSCLATIFACIWKSAHPNIDGPTDSGWTRMKRRLIIMLCTVVAPELVLLWALRQYNGAKYFARKYNEEFARPGETERSLREKVAGWFRPLPKATMRRGDGQSWTMTHGFFIQMGGFILYDNEYPKAVLDYDRLAELIRDKAINAPTVTERELQDRSKGDTISKAIVVQQTMWFVVQCLARAQQRLPLSELEVLTLAFAFMNAAIYAAWWNKPQGVDMAVGVPLKRGKSEAGSSTGPSTSKEPYEPENDPESEHISLPQSDQHAKDKLPLIPPPDHENHPNEHLEETQSWLWRKARKDYQDYSFLPFLVVRLPFRIFTSVVRPIAKVNRPKAAGRKTNLRVPIFYSVVGEENEDGAGDGDILGLAASIFIGPIFGAIHFIAWASEFPSPHDRVLWCISAILMTAEPLLLLLGGVIHVMGMNAIGNGLFVLFTLLVPFYIAARFACIIIALKAIVHPPLGVLLNVSWTSYIPHV